MEPEDDTVSRTFDFVKQALEDSSLLDSKPQNEAEANLLSHLRCLTGFKVASESRALSRSSVYTLSNYSAANQWGPDSWRHTEHIVCAPHSELILRVNDCLKRPLLCLGI